jgi:hypothetical protein
LKRLACSILLILPCGAFSAEIYRSIDANGVVVYSDRPEGEGIERIVIRTGTPSAGTSTRSAASDNNNAAANSTAAAAPVAEIPREATPAEIAADRARNCQIARDKATAFSTAHRLFRNGANGERVYLSDVELQEARTKADSDVASWCD